MMQQAQRAVFGQTLVALARAYPELVVLDGDLANSTKADLFAEMVPERFLQMGIAEQNMLSVAAGLATVGLVPWISTFTAFLVNRALDQIRVQVAQPGLKVMLVGSYSGVMTNRTGKSHQSVEDLAVMRAMPHMTVLAPADGPELAACMAAMMEHPGPVYLRINREPVPSVIPEGTFQIGKAHRLREGKDIALIATGAQTLRALTAAQALATEGVFALVLHVPTVKPLDEEAVLAAAQQCRAIVTCEEHSIVGGLGSAVCELLCERLPTRVRRLGLADCYTESGEDGALIEKYGLSETPILQAARALLGSAAIA